jgi:hypothetical protein
MKKNIRVPVSFSQDLRGDGQAPLFYPMAISLVCHMVFLVIFVVTPSLRSERPQARSVINVSMVSLKTPPRRIPKRLLWEARPPKSKSPRW